MYFVSFPANSAAKGHPRGRYIQGAQFPRGVNYINGMKSGAPIPVVRLCDGLDSSVIEFISSNPLASIRYSAYQV